MIKLPSKIFFENKIYFFYKTFDIEANAEVIYKIPKNPSISREDVNTLKNELNISRSITSDRIVKSLRLDKYDDKYVLVREFVKGVELRKKFVGKISDISAFLKVAMSIVEAIKDLHDSGVYHKDINPSNIIIDESGRITLIDLGIGAKIMDATEVVDEEFNGTPDYISPELTGRVNRKVDLRTDFYSLGVTFYHLTCGQLPFSGDESMELVHKHIAAEIPLLHLDFNSVPLLYSRIVAKLMAKNPDDRYQSASGILFDLSKSKEIIDTKDTLFDQKNYTLGQLDLITELRIPDHLYGRDKELDKLNAAIENLKEQSKRFILIDGKSGTGKTALALKLKEIAFKKSCYFIEGKFDHLQKSTPYSALINGLLIRIDNILLGDKGQIEFWSDRFKKVLGRYGKIVIDILPNLELLIGPQEAIPILNGTESQNRFNNTFLGFIKALGSKENPAVFLINDLQWADFGSITILQNLLQESSNNGILIVGTYRSNEVHVSHPLSLMIRTLKENGLQPDEITLHDLSYKDVSQLCMDCFTGALKIHELAEIIYQKTNGNAFFTIQLLKGLHKQGSICINKKTRIWEWDIDKIKDSESSLNVVDYMTAKLADLSAEAFNVLTYASCFGNSFERKLLESVISISYEEFDRGIDEALILGLLNKTAGNKDKRIYQFAHDRVQQAAYQSLKKEYREKLHLNIARTLIKIVPEDQKGERHFEIVNQMNNGIDFISSSKEKKLLLGLNISASRMAKKSAAYDIGLNYAKIGFLLLQENHWNTDYKNSLTIYNEIAENAFLKTNFDEAHLHIDSIIKNAKKTLDTETAYKLKVFAFHAQNQLLDSIYAGLNFLDKLGVRMPKNPGTISTLRYFLSTRWSLKNETIKSLYEKPLMTDLFKLAAIRMLSYLNAPAYIGLPKLLPILILEQVKLSIKYGNTPASSSGYGGYGLILCGVTGEMRHGALYGQLAKDLIEKYNAEEEFAKAHLITNVFVRHWTLPILESQSTTHEIYTRGVEVGDYVYAAYGAEVYCFMHLFGGTPLTEISEEVDAYDYAVWNIINQKNTALAISSIRQTIHHLMDPNYTSGKLKGDFYDYNSSCDFQIKTDDLNGVFKAAVYQMMMYYLFGKYKAAATVVKTARTYKEAGVALFHIGAFYFYTALIKIELLPKLKGLEKLNAIVDLKLCIQKIKWFKKSAGFSYDNKYDLILAEWYRYKNNKYKAKEYFESSIKHAGKNGLIHERALACERYSLYLESLGETEPLGYFIKKSINDYEVYGAMSKVVSLTLKYRAHLSIFENTSYSSLKGTTRSTTRSNLDMSTFYKTAQVISGEIILESLLKKIMSLILENAGANKGWFLIKVDENWCVRAFDSISKDDKSYTDLIILSNDDTENHPLSLRVVEYTERTSKPVILKDAATTGKFSQNETIIRLKSKSVFCIPIINQGKILGIIYLVNDLISNAFTQDNVELLNLLTSQLSGSLQNAILYDSLETQVKERTLDVTKEKDLSESLLKNILPDKIAAELKDQGFVEAKHHSKVSVLFTDFADFTKLTKTVSPKKLVKELDFIFSQFDEINKLYGIEKIKTIGDSYMAASGIPVPGIDDEVRIIKAAFAMIEFLEKVKQKRIDEKSDFYFQARIGIHTGEVIAGVVGKNKFAYDIWGGTVNLASRMESNGEPGKINISEATYEQVKTNFKCTSRGKIKIKNLDSVEMYFVDETLER